MKQLFKDKRINRLLLYFAILLYLSLSVVTLSKYPFMHSDESWLSGLTRSMMNEGLKTTETFFDLLPRYPHAIKILFHLLQMLFIAVFGYSLTAVRIISLIFGCAALFLVYNTVLQLSKSKTYAFLSMTAIAFDVQFIYASHFARQEIIMAFGILLILFNITKNINEWTLKKDLATGAIIGLLIGFHPNSFIAALIAGSVYLYFLFIEKKVGYKNLIVLVGTVAGFALVFVGISYIFDSQFITHYLTYGDNLGVTMTFGEKVEAIVPFYQKLWYGVSGTYYTPWVKIQMLLFAAAIICGIVYAFFNKKVLVYLFPIAAINAGYIIIGRYSQPSIFFMFIVCWMLVFYLVSLLVKNRNYILTVLTAVMIIVSAVQIIPFINDDYENYISQIESIVPDDAKVLANLNAEYAFSYDSLIDYRNLAYLDENGMTFAEYVKSNGIEYIIYPEEMDYIYETRPVWNIVYGNLYPYYEDMQDFFDSECELIYEFNSPYAMRITRYMSEKEWSVKIYKVK